MPVRNLFGGASLLPASAAQNRTVNIIGQQKSKQDAFRSLLGQPLTTKEDIQRPLDNPVKAPTPYDPTMADPMVSGIPRSSALTRTPKMPNESLIGGVMKKTTPENTRPETRKGGDVTLGGVLDITGNGKPATKTAPQPFNPPGLPASYLASISSQPEVYAKKPKVENKTPGLSPEENRKALAELIPRQKAAQDKLRATLGGGAQKPAGAAKPAAPAAPTAPGTKTTTKQTATTSGTAKTPAVAPAVAPAAAPTDRASIPSVSRALGEMMSGDNPYIKRAMEKAEALGRRMANQRGMLNSSLAGQYAQEALLDELVPIAMADTEVLSQFRLAEQKFGFDQALTMLRGDIEKEMQQAGFTFEAGQQTQRIESQEAMQGKDIISREKIAELQAETSRRNAAASASASIAGARIAADTQIRRAEMQIKENERQFDREMRAGYVSTMGQVQDDYRTAINGIQNTEGLTPEQKTAALDAVSIEYGQHFDFVDSVYTGVNDMDFGFLDDETPSGGQFIGAV